MDEHTQKALIVFLAKQLKENWRDLIAHRAVMEMLRNHGQAAAVDELLDSARKSLELHDEFKVYCSTLEQILPPEWETLDAETQRLLNMLSEGKKPD
jgi:hypothetical protein